MPDAATHSDLAPEPLDGHLGAFREEVQHFDGDSDATLSGGRLVDMTHRPAADFSNDGVSLE